MNQDNDNEFWSKLGETLRPRLTEAHWTAQRARILSRLTPKQPGRLRPWAAAAALACLAGLWFLLPGGKTQTKVAGPTEAPPTQAQPTQAQPAEASTWDARITMVQGQVTVFARGSDEGVPAAEEMPVEEGDHVRTGADGRAELALSADSVIDLGPGSAITLSNLDPKQTLLDLDLGTLVAKLRWKGTPGRRLDVMTPTVVAAVRGTEFGVTVQEGGDTSVGVFDEGKVAVRTKDTPAIEETMLEPRQEVHVPKGPQVETETREGRSYLRVNELSRLKPYQERIERIRERPEALSRAWKEMARPEREQIRSRMTQEHRSRMQALSPEDQQSMRERLSRPERGQRESRKPRQGDDGGPSSDVDRRSRQPGEENPRRGPGDRFPRGEDTVKPGQQPQDRDGQRRGDGRRRHGQGGPDDGAGFQPDGQSPRDKDARKPGQRPQDGDGQGRGDGRMRPGPGSRQPRQGPGPREGGGLRPQGGQNKSPSQQNRRPAGPGRGRRR
ncbi:MAG: FecR domain-containing protein [Elusimicrobia bacterium]|nr:FecR domain-containing protein [Elusimicrobiota bacterium]